MQEKNTATVAITIGVPRPLPRPQTHTHKGTHKHRHTHTRTHTLTHGATETDGTQTNVTIITEEYYLTCSFFEEFKFTWS